MIEVKAIKLTSVKTVVPYEYYALPFCKPEGGELHYKSENLGEVMRGDRIVNTPYEVFMKKDASCHTLCTASGNAKVTIDKSESELLRQRIAEDYHKHKKFSSITDTSWDGLMNRANFLEHHLDINLKFHEPTPGVYRSKYSIKQGEKSCSIEHLDTPQQLMDGANEIMWTYSVRWEESEIPWASRWDTYLNMKDVQIHWFSILNSLVVVICLTGFLSVIIIRTVRRDIAQYNRDEDIEDTLEETGWKLVHGDVFRPPRYGMLLVNLVGTGIQLLGMVAVTVSFACLACCPHLAEGH
uniref:Transmembrane 9 superfamily member n=1 Tax=Ditylenchus dipsaci TaxID=166011 RepID=A0A915EG53_9BILA